MSPLSGPLGRSFVVVEEDVEALIGRLNEMRETIEQLMERL